MRHALLAVAALLACSRDQLAPEKVYGIRSALPAWPERFLQGGPASGTLERRDGRGGSVALSWDADERGGAVTEAEALAAAGLGAGTSASPGEVSTHRAFLVSSESAKVLVWRCDKTRRLLRLVTSPGVDPVPLSPGLGCHAVGDKPVNGEVPVADTALLGPRWRFARRQPASASWLREDAVLTLFAGQRAAGPRDFDAAQKLAPGWAAAAGLRAALVEGAAFTEGPRRHRAVRVRGRARLDGRPVRFTLDFWRCIARGRSHAALVFAEEATERAEGQWTAQDQALAAVRCHG